MDENSKICFKSELQRAKNKLKTNILFQWNSSTSVVEELGRQTLSTGKLLSPNDILQQIDHISVSDIRCTMDKYFNDVEVSVIGIGPVEELPDYLFTRGRTYWYRF